jgi:GDP-L-fucose synthase
MQKDDNIFIAGHLGMVGSAIQRQLLSQGYNKILTREHKDLDLTNQEAVDDFFHSQNIDYVILAAAKVGGIYANNKFPADFIYENLMIQANVINSAFKSSVKRLLFLGSSCVYPKITNQPISEEALLSSFLEPTNEPYAVAKIAGIKLCESYNRQFDTDFRSIMPSNLYGVNDNFHPKNSHVIPALIARFHKSKIEKKSSVKVWGSGDARREFLYVDDMAKASIFVLSLEKQIYLDNTQKMQSHINVGAGIDISIRELVDIIKDVVGFNGEVFFDKSKPEGTKRKLLNINRLTNMGWKFNTQIRDGIEKTYKWYLENNQT